MKKYETYLEQGRMSGDVVMGYVYAESYAEACHKGYNEFEHRIDEHCLCLDSP